MDFQTEGNFRQKLESQDTEGRFECRVYTRPSAGCRAETASPFLSQHEGRTMDTAVHGEVRKPWPVVTPPPIRSTGDQ